MSARDWFASVREASLDAERCKRQLSTLERRMHATGGGGFEPRVRGGGSDPDKMGRRVGAYVDMESVLSRRMEDDYELIDRACTVLYGKDQDGRGGVCGERGPTWADVLWWRFCAAETWRNVARSVGYSVRPCQEMCSQALAWIDESGIAEQLIAAPLPCH